MKREHRLKTNESDILRFEHESPERYLFLSFRVLPDVTWLFAKLCLTCRTSWSPPSLQPHCHTYTRGREGAGMATASITMTAGRRQGGRSLICATATASPAAAPPTTPPPTPRPPLRLAPCSQNDRSVTSMATVSP